ncbi:uncharacterized protein MELLADRAFT_113676 [Melampsora larici-populina 98AG31]|uniref:Uncharacterized protein n=1 Tax=Melampsora larici-populina (strain 98AG31 / pathotype 3-4-7) TaxID=747676 RepID=F4SAQ3_MELLP|nr:uncharacterized protein MELLADRAFT_113676 [Melampsora larici-populina 98AG31]EGF98277.1 hypothetical protein MELLADRAFT_113676 [Melampsora larici-populina 98AG31]
MPVSFNIHRQGLPIPDDQLPIRLGQILIPPHLHKFLYIKEGQAIRATASELFELIACFHPSTDFNIHYTDLRSFYEIHGFRDQHHEVLYWMKKDCGEMILAEMHLSKSPSITSELLAYSVLPADPKSLPYETST